MDYTEREWRDLLGKAFSKPILRGFLLAVIDGYIAAPGACKKALDVPDRHDALGGVRRGKIHEQIRGVAHLHSLKLLDEPNSKGSTFFLSVFSGKFRLVACAVGRSRAMVRPARIRELWARHNRDSQSTLAFIPKEDKVPPEVIYLAIIIHGPRGRRRDQPAFVDIVVPDRHFKKYMCTFDLLKMFPKVATDLVHAPESSQRKEPKSRKPRGEKENLG